MEDWWPCKRTKRGYCRKTASAKPRRACAPEPGHDGIVILDFQIPEPCVCFLTQSMIFVTGARAGF